MYHNMGVCTPNGYIDRNRPNIHPFQRGREQRMILSMTGFGRSSAVRNGREITVELRSVNSRYFE